MNKNKAFNALLKNNLKTSFTQPVTYFMAIVFEVFICFNFYIRKQFFSGNGTSDLLLFFSAVPYISIIIIPALCYKFNSAIYDSFVPLKQIEKSLAHYLSSLIIYSIFAALLIPGALFVNLFGSVDAGQVFTGFFFLILYGAAVVSVCIFVNELFSVPLVSFIVSALILALFNSAHLLVVYLSFSDFFVSLLKELSFAWHFDAASKGIIDTRDLLYFAVTGIFFILLSAVTSNIKKGKQFSKKEKTTGIVSLLIFVFLLLNINAYYGRIDCSKNKTFSINKYSKQLSKKIDSSMKITYYRSSSLSKLYPQIRDVQDFLRNYADSNSNISFIIKDPDKDSSLSQTLENYGITSQSMQSVKKNGTEYLNVYSAVVFEYMGNIAVIPFTMNVESLEYDIDVKVNQLLSGKQRVVNVVCGNGMSLGTDYNYVIPWLNSQGFVCNPLFVEDPSFAQNLKLSSGPLFVIGDSQINIEAAIAIEEYILSEKGNAFLCINPYSVDIEGDWSLTANAHTNLIEMVENWGIWFEDKIAADISCSQITMYSQEENDNAFTQSSTTTKVLNYPLWVNLMPQQYCKNGATVFWATPVTITESESTDSPVITPVLVTSPYSYYFTCDKNSPKNLIQTNPFEIAGLSTADKVKKQQIVGVEISGKLSGLYNYGAADKAKVFVIPDQYFVNTLMTGYIGGQYGDYRNFDFMTKELLYLNNEPELADLHSKTKVDRTLYKCTDERTFVIRELITLGVLLILIPVLILIGGLTVWLKRKSHLMHI